MDIAKHLQTEYNTAGIVYLAQAAANDSKIFKQLFQIYLQGEETLKRRAAWSLGHTAVINPKQFKNTLPGLVKQLETPALHQSLYRCAFKCLEEIDIGEKYLGKIFDLACRYLVSEIYEAAVRAFAITVATKCAMPYRELRDELKLVLRTLISENQSPAIRVRVKKALKDLA